MHVGLTEIIVALFVIVLIFGAKRIPDLGDAFGRSVRSIKRAITGDDLGKAVDVTPRKNPSDRADTPSGD